MAPLKVLRRAYDHDTRASTKFSFFVLQNSRFSQTPAISSSAIFQKSSMATGSKEGVDPEVGQRRRRSGVGSVRWFDFEMRRKVNKIDGGDDV